MHENLPRLGLPLMQQGQAQKHVTHNEALELLDILVQLTVEAFEAVDPPASAEEGQVWALAADATGAWSGKGGTLAAWANGGWLFVTPKPGWRAARGDEIRIWSGSAWVPPRPPRLDGLPGLGVGTSHDDRNRLAVASPSVLLTHAGGDHRLMINKATSGDTGSVLFQTDWSGRAEMGLAGEDDFSVKVSPDGAIWHDAIRIARATGRTRVTGMRETLGAARTFHVRTDGNDANTGLSDAAGGAFRTIGRALEIAFGTLDLGRYDVTILVAPGIYEEWLEITAPSVGAGVITLRGTGASPGEVIIRGTSASAPAHAPFGVVRVWNGATLGIHNLQVERASGPSAACFDIRFGGALVIAAGDAVWLGATNQPQIRLVGGGTWMAEGATVRAVGDAASLILCRQGSSASFVSATVDIGGRTYTTAVFNADRAGVIAAHTGLTLVGAATGPRVRVQSNGVVDFGSRSLSGLPGTSDGIIDTGGVYLAGMGEVVERGSNANGDFVRFRDGTQICTQQVPVGNCTDPVGPLFRSPPQTWTFPAAFLNATNVAVSGLTASERYCAGELSSPTTFAFRVVAPISSTVPAVCRLNAIGRWK